jgi:hypothetical protein
MKLALVNILLLAVIISRAQTPSDSSKIEQLRAESGVDPTRVMTRLGYTILINDQKGNAGRIGNRFSATIGVGRWSFTARYEVIAKTTGVPGTGFESGANDLRFSILNAFYVSGRHALAGSAEFFLPTGKPGFGAQYFSMVPSITYSFTINPTLFFALQPQYSFHLMKDPLHPDLSVLTIRPFLAKFTKTGYFFVIEPRPIINLESNSTNWILSPIIGKSLGKGFNLVGLLELPVTENTREQSGTLFQFGFNKNL